MATDSADNVLVFNRGEHPVIVFDRHGRFLRSWGEGVFRRPHGIRVGPDDSVYCIDDFGHCVHKFSADGQLLWTLGTPGKASETGATTVDYRTIRRSAGRVGFHRAELEDLELLETEAMGRTGLGTRSISCAARNRHRC